jgi:YHS domain-containing protein
MDRLLSFLLFAVFFYLMMRFGCGAHMVHGSHGGHGHEGVEGAGGTEATAKDPVCGMPVAAGKGYSEVFHGHELHFCSKQCLDKFDSQPQQYAA